MVFFIALGCFLKDKSLSYHASADGTSRKAESTLECQYMCQTDAKCLAFDYHTSQSTIGGGKHRKNCYFKGEAFKSKPPVNTEGAMSGPKFC